MNTNDENDKILERLNLWRAEQGMKQLTRLEDATQEYLDGLPVCQKCGALPGANCQPQEQKMGGVMIHSIRLAPRRAARALEGPNEEQRRHEFARALVAERLKGEATEANPMDERRRLDENERRTLEAAIIVCACLAASGIVLFYALQ